MNPESAALDFGRFDVAAQSSVGVAPTLRPENQDNYLLIDVRGQAEFLIGQQLRRYQLPHWRTGHARVAVLDGMGGHGQGREVAEAVVEGLLSIPACATQSELNQALDELHTSLQQYFGAQREAARRPGTTLTLLELPPNRPALLYHVGDSRLYAIDHDAVRPLTIDHVPATAYALAGQIGESEWWQLVHGEHRSQISQAFILGNAFGHTQRLADPLYELTPLNLPPWLCQLGDRRAIPLEPGTTYLLASDGFWACAAPADWVAQWPDLLAPQLSARAAVAALFRELETHPPADLHVDNITAIALRLRPEEIAASHEKF